MILCSHGKLTPISLDVDGHNNYSDITWVAWHLKSQATQLFVQQFVEANRVNIKAVHYWPFVMGIHSDWSFVREIPCHDWWIPLTKGQ